MRGDNAQAHIQRFLRDYPDGRLYVAVGYASVWGLAWLQNHAQGRPVTLIIGDTKRHHFEKATDSDRRKALAFLRRRDVQVRNWYRTARSAEGKSRLHAKAWVVEAPESREAIAGLIGSANLTKVGLQDNWEMMAVVGETELARIWAQLDGFLQGRTVKNKPWDARANLLEIIDSDKIVQARPKSVPTQEQKAPVAKKKGGCFTLAAAIGGMAAAIAATLLLLL